MEARIVKIGSSVGVIMPSFIVKDMALQTGKTLDLLLKNNHIVLTKKNPREGWEAAAKEMHQQEDDHLLFPDIFEDDIIEEWQ
jgi:antitoxin MazE